MRRYIARRVLLMVPTLAGVVVLIFVLMRVVPGDVAALIVGGEGGTTDLAAVEKVRHELGLDQPIYVQFARWVSDLLRGDLGTSYWFGEPVVGIFVQRLPLTLQLAAMALVVSILIGIPAGVVSAVRQDTWLDYAFRVFAIAGLSMPAFWLGLLIILLLVRNFQWMPPPGYISFFEDPAANLKQLVWPAMAVGYRASAVIARMTRSSLLEVLREDYIRTAWAKGLGERLVIARHALKNALLPVVTIIGIEFALLITGLVVTETVFTLPGVGRLLVDSIFHRDYPMVQVLMLFFASVVVVANLTVDLLYGVLDPRIRYT